MSLQVWLPLNGNLENQGLADVIPTLMGTGITYVAGKIGQAIQCPNTCNSCIHMPGLKLQTGSWAAWIKVLGSGATSRQCLISEGRDSYNDGVEFYTNQAGTTLYFKAHAVVLSTTIALNTWYHVVGTFGNNTIKLYVDGIQKATNTYTDDMTYTYSNDRFVLGKMAYSYTNTSNYFSYNGCLNDVRIYDHALSAKEVKELSKGLVLHYKLSGVGGENLLTNTKTFTIPSGGNGLTTDTYNGFIVRHLSPRSGSSYREVAYYNSFIPVESEGLYTQSFWAKGTGKLKCHFYSGNIACATNTSNQGVSNTATDGAIDITLTSDWKRYWVTHTLKSSSDTPTNKSILLRCWDGENEVYVCGWKCEKGYKATPWCPNPSDPEYTFLEYNSTAEYDHSGYGNDGVKVGSFEYDINTPRYTTSYIFENDCNQYIHTNHFSNLTQSITMSCWAYQTSATATSGGNSISALFIISQGRDYDKFGFGIRSVSGVPYLYFTTTSNYLLSSNVNILNGWHHLAATYDGASAKIYVDGVLKATQNTSGDIDYTYDSDKFVVGKMSYGYSSTTAYFPFVGDISDVRIYATPLSEKDIKELYAVGTAFDKQGRVMTYEVVEV